ncbi:alpha/beta-hydrolase [Parathielavia hyrcaniae]|uniref:Alpha/beta-hydrolase n=1 Tax=Parathielavia hyrcaniae TaxID=113614 RepID=A0AAN6T5W8_9PEZI|nr:alpha/beta-hydrolase [Parathielavia hyrcaniae]
MHTTTVGLAVTPTIFSTLLSHYLKRKRLAHKPTAHLSYDEGLHLVRSFLVHASHHTVEELQAFTSQWVPHPQWVRVDHVEIPEKDLLQAADLLAEQLGPDGIRQVGGKQWWQWRMPRSPLKAEWIEMKGDYQERKKNTDLGNRVMLYVHGGAYYFGSVDEHRYQIQRHARKLKARALAPRYRLAPQFPFPCGLQDCLATYLYLISQKKPSSIILAGDSAGAGMVLSMMVILRDRGIPLPAGAVLISPWVDLTHSFPSVAGDCPLDYIPPSGFHHKSSEAWPPPDEEELEELKKAAMAQKKEMPGQHGETAEQKGIPTAKDVAEATHRLTFLIDGEQVEVKEQIQMYTTNELLAHPLVSPIMQPTLGGLPPLLIMVGGGELLRDEQIYLAHKCANPAEYLPPEALMDEKMKALVDRYRPTDVQLQVWDDLCHVAPTLSFTKPAKFMYRFSAWALGRAQKTEVDILNDDQISVVSDSASSASDSSSNEVKEEEDSPTDQPPKHHHHHHHTSVGKAGDPLPPFTNHMIRQRVTRHGAIHPLPPAPSLPGCCMARDLVGVVKVGTVRKWLAHKRRWDARFGPTKARVHRRRLRDVAVGYEVFGAGEVPPPSALAGRRRRVDVGGEKKKKKKREKGLGLSLWALWGSKHDEMAVQRERDAGRGAAEVAAGPGQGLGAGSLDLRPAGPLFDGSKGGHGEGEEGGGGEEDLGGAHAKASFLSPDDHGTGVTGKRVFIGGLATPFSMHKEHDTASMITLASAIRPSTADSSSAVAASSVKDVSADTKRVGSEELDKDVSLGHGSAVDATPGLETAFVTPFLSPASPGERPGLERFVTADEKPLN